MVFNRINVYLQIMEQIIDQQEITQRINELIQKSEKTIRRFAIDSKIDPSAFDKKTKGKLVWTIKDVNKISQNMKIRKGWLLDGEGEMCIAPDEFLEEIPAVPSRSYNAHVGVPYYNVDFSMGYDLMVNDQTTNCDYMINFTPYNKCDAWCNATGNSMLPTIASGDIIALKKINDFHFLISGEIYAIVTINDLRTIKRVKDNGKTITLIPDNKDYPEQTIDKHDIRMVFQVMGSMKKF